VTESPAYATGREITESISRSSYMAWIIMDDAVIRLRLQTQIQTIAAKQKSAHGFRVATETLLP
jgi:hypothetical protein